VTVRWFGLVYNVSQQASCGYALLWVASGGSTAGVRFPFPTARADGEHLPARSAMFDAWFTGGAGKEVPEMGKAALSDGNGWG
jgi:hypothetical protein